MLRVECGVIAKERDEALEQLRLANIDAFNNEAEANELRKQTWDHGGAVRTI
jgi:hypothetical protein